MKDGRPIQHGRQIFNMTASFQHPEEGLEHEAQMPDVPDPEGLDDQRRMTVPAAEQLPEKLRRYLTQERPFVFRACEQNVFKLV